MDLDAVRTFLAVADSGQFSTAAAGLDLSQQAVSKRIAALERELDVRLFARTPRGAQLTAAGQAFRPAARELLRAAARATASVRPDRPLRVDVPGRRLAPAALLRGFHAAHPEATLELVTLPDAAAAMAAVADGTVDAAIRAVTARPAGLATARVLDEPVQLLTGPGHPLADAGRLVPAQLAGHRIWMPALVPGAEWTAYYEALAAAFGLAIETTGPGSGAEPLLDAIAAAPDLATFVGEQTHLIWPASFGLRRLPLHGPVSVYPHSLIWRPGQPHPALAALRAHLAPPPPAAPGATWVPAWAQS